MADAQPTYDDLTLWGELERIQAALNEWDASPGARLEKIRAILDEMFGRLAG